LQRILIALFSVIVTLSIVSCSHRVIKDHDRFGTGYGHRGKTADTVDIPLPLPDVNIGGDKTPAPPGYEIDSAHCSGDSVQFSLAGKRMIAEGNQATVAVSDLVFQYSLGVKDKPRLNIERTPAGMQYTYTVYCRDREQKARLFPCIAY
jgi:hypothetical protein